MKTNILGGAWAAIVPLTAAIGVYLFFVFFRSIREIRDLRADIAMKETASVTAVTIPTRLKSIDTDSIATREYLEKFRTALADPAAMSLLFGELSQVVKNSGAITTTFRPEAKLSLAELERTPVTIGCRGTFEQAQALPASIESMPYRIWIEHTKLETGGENA